MPCTSPREAVKIRHMKNFHQWFLGLTPGQRERYAVRAGTTVKYLSLHLIHRTRMPTLPMLTRLAKASKGEWSVEELGAWFMRRRPRKA